ncbi:MAG: hypothetical protein PHU42_01260 [Patescibacteria group bacterium]|nr:hypothetical protein [Patescibacteria group bacterium]
MGKSTINWYQLKLEYLEDQSEKSPYQWLKDVKGWEKTTADTKNTREHTNKWERDRHEIRTKIEEDKKRLIEKEAKKVNIELKEGKLETLRILEARKHPRKVKKVIYKTVKQKNPDGSETSDKTPMIVEVEVEPSVRELTWILEKEKTELGEVISINQNLNVPHDDSMVEHNKKLNQLLTKIQKDVRHARTAKTKLSGKKKHSYK